MCQQINHTVTYRHITYKSCKQSNVYTVSDPGLQSHQAIYSAMYADLLHPAPCGVSNTASCLMPKYYRIKCLFIIYKIKRNKKYKHLKCFFWRHHQQCGHLYDLDAKHVFAKLSTRSPWSGQHRQDQLDVIDFYEPTLCLHVWLRLENTFFPVLEGVHLELCALKRRFQATVLHAVLIVEFESVIL